MCLLCLSNPLVDWHNLDPSTNEPLQAGTGAGGTSNGTSVGINTALVDQLNSGSNWYTSTGAVATTISYGFTTSNTFATGFSEASGWSAFTEAQKTAVRQMMALWDDLIAPSFVEATTSPNTADIKFSNSTTGVSYAHAYYPGQVNSEAGSYDKISGSVWLNPTYNSGVNNLVTPTSGVYGYMAILHEIGHTLGLDHGGNYNGGAPAYGNTSTGWLYTEDSRQFTIMSYFNASATGASWTGYAQTPMVYDILAIQQMYGADYTTRAGNTVYGFNSNAGSIYDFTQNTQPILTIWDGSGTDTIDLSGWSTASVLSLVAGSYSNVAGMTKNLAIAFNVDIENATGGSGSDTITGNDLANTLLGNGGNDTINGAGGNDTINGGAGVDILNGGAGDDTIYFDTLDNLTLLNGGGGFDTLIQLGVYITFDYVSHSFERLLNIISDLASAAWAQQTDYYDVTNLYYQCDITYDNGTRSVTEYDVYNTETWSEWTVTYAANGSIISQVFVPDGGSTGNIAPVISSNGGGATAAVNVSENTTAVTTVAASDADAGTTLAYSIVGGADAAKFTINSSTGALSFVSAPNFEAATDAGANNVYDVQVQVSDGALSDTQTIAVTVTNQNETPAITSNGGGATAAINVTENSTAVTTVTSSDVDAGATKAYSIVGGADAAKFTINSSTGVLSFVSAPNFEAATDAGANNVYDVQVQVSDGALTDTQSIAVTVTNQNEAPTITSIDPQQSVARHSHGKHSIGTLASVTTSTITVAEGTTVAMHVTATDPDFGTILTYSIIGGADAAKFTINATTSVLSFVSAPDFEAPTDTGANNVYDVQVQVSDGALTDTQTVAVTVTDVDDIATPTIIVGTSSKNVLTGTAGVNKIDGQAGNDTIAGLGGADELIGGAGTDTATYAASVAGVNVSLMTGVGTGGDAQGDTLATIENLTGSNFDDTLEGNGGTNVLAGGLGIDTVNYANATAGVTVNLATTKAQNTLGAGSDKLSGFENLTGSAFNDRLTGNSASNTLHSGAGNDILNGGAGADTFDFSKLTDGSDVITDFVRGVDDIGLMGLLDTAGLGGLDYATLIARGHLVVETGFFSTGLSSNSASTLDTRIYIDVDGIGPGASVLIATLEDALTNSGDFLI